MQRQDDFKISHLDDGRWIHVKDENGKWIKVKIKVTEPEPESYPFWEDFSFSIQQGMAVDIAAMAQNLLNADYRRSMVDTEYMVNRWYTLVKPDTQKTIEDRLDLIYGTVIEEEKHLLKPHLESLNVLKQQFKLLSDLIDDDVVNKLRDQERSVLVKKKVQKILDDIKLEHKAVKLRRKEENDGTRVEKMRLK